MISALARLQRARAAELDLAHVRDVEQAGGGAHRLVLGDHAGVLHRHVPAGEVDHPRPELAVGLVERRRRAMAVQAGLLHPGEGDQGCADDTRTPP